MSIICAVKLHFPAKSRLKFFIGYLGRLNFTQNKRVVVVVAAINRITVKNMSGAQSVLAINQMLGHFSHHWPKNTAQPLASRLLKLRFLDNKSLKFFFACLLGLLHQ